MKGFQPPDYSLLDIPEISATIFHPRKHWTPPPAQASDHRIEVEPGIEIGCRFYEHDKLAPTILYFHGNGEIVYDYDYPASFYLKSEINLFVADFRGYGTSDGDPSIPSMLADAHAIFDNFRRVLDEKGFSGKIFVMGRSMGCNSAVELAAYYPEALSGLIAESGAASVSRWVDLLISKGKAEEATELERRHIEKIQSITIPVLMIHGERDQLVPLARALEFYLILTTEDKALETIPGAGHNDIMLIGWKKYFEAVNRFVHR